MKAPLLLIALLCITVASHAQRISESTMSMAYGSHNAVVIEVRDGDDKYVSQQWKDFLKTYGKLKNVKKSDEKVVENIRIAQVNGSQSFHLYSRISELSTTTQLIVWADLGADGYLSSDDQPDAYEGLVEMLKEFEYTVRRNRAALAVEEQEKILQDYEKELDKLARENDKLHSTIEKAKETIAQAEQDIITNTAEQEEAKRKIETQEGTVEDVKEKHRKMKKSDDN